MIYLPIIGSLLESAGIILEKKVLRRNGLNFKNYTTYEFLAIVLTMIPIMFFAWGIKPEAFRLANMLIFALVVVVSIVANLLIFYSLKRENVTEFEPIWLMQSIFVIILAFILFKSERNLLVFGLAMVASLALIVAHVKKEHLVFDKYIVSALLGSFLFAVELILSKPILQFYNPFTFYFLRCLGVFIICWILFKPDGKDLDRKTEWTIISIGLMWAFYRAIMYYGFENIGVIFTTMLFILSAVFTFLFAVVFLKEKPTMRQIISTIVIVICVVLSVVLK
jgi:drug/metabolite transporter (DMT)-like permease